VGEFNQNQEAIAARTKATLARYTPRTEREAGERSAILAKRQDRVNAELVQRASGPVAVAAKQRTDLDPGLPAVVYDAAHVPEYQRTANP
jgi:hypothetical protein